MQMDKVTQMNLTVRFEVSCTYQWLGEEDGRTGEHIEEATYQARAYVFGNEVARSNPGTIFRSPSAAVRACMDALGEASRDQYRTAQASGAEVL